MRARGSHARRFEASRSNGSSQSRSRRKPARTRRDEGIVVGDADEDVGIAILDELAEQLIDVTLADPKGRSDDASLGR